MYSAYKLNKQGDNIQPWCTPFLIWNQSIVWCLVLTVSSWPAYMFLRRQIRWSGIPIMVGEWNLRTHPCCWWETWLVQVQIKERPCSLSLSSSGVPYRGQLPGKSHCSSSCCVPSASRGVSLLPRAWTLSLTSTSLWTSRWPLQPSDNGPVHSFALCCHGSKLCLDLLTGVSLCFLPFQSSKLPAPKVFKNMNVFRLFFLETYQGFPLLIETHPQSSVYQFSSLSHSLCWLFVIPWTAACQASLSITNSWSLLKLMSIELVIPSNHLILCLPLLLLPSIFPSIMVFSKESVHQVAKVLEFQLQHQSY